MENQMIRIILSLEELIELKKQRFMDLSFTCT